MVKKILVFLMALLIFALPLTVSAEVAQSQEYNVNISATVDGVKPTSGEYTVKIQKEVFDDEYDIYLSSGSASELKLDSQNGYAKRYAFSLLQGERLAFTIVSGDNAVVADDHTFYAVFYQQEGLVITYENEEGSEEIELLEGQTDYNLVFANKSAPGLTEITAKVVDGKKITKVYDGNTDATVGADCCELVGVLDGDDVALEVTSAKFNDVSVKKANKVVLNGFKLIGKDASKYKLTTNKLELSGEITPRTITVAANNTVMTLGDNEPTLTYNVTGDLIGEDKLIGELARTPGNEVGTYVITMGTLTLSGNSDNYNVVFNEGTFTISNFSLNTVTDSASSVSIKGYFDASSTITVKPISATDSKYKSFFDNAAWGKVVSAYNIVFNNDSFDGDITITFPVPSECKGKEIAIYQLMKNGAVTCYKTTATDSVSLTTSECSQFMLVTNKGVVDEGEPEEKRSAIATVLIVLLIILGVIIGLVLLIVLLFFGMIFFNKTEELKAIIRGIKKLFRK